MRNGKQVGYDLQKGCMNDRNYKMKLKYALFIKNVLLTI